MKAGNKYILYSVLIVAAIFIVFFVSAWLFGEDEYETATYNYFEFVKIDNIWYTEWQKDDVVYTLSFRNNPYEIEQLPIVGKLNDSFNRPEIYITFNPAEGNFSILALAAGELSLNLFRALQVKPIAACMNNATDDCIERPIVQCGDAGKSVIQIDTRGEPGVALRGECIILQGEGMGLLQSVDRLLYQWYGIMDN